MWLELRANRDVVLAAVANEGFVLQYASPELRADRDVVLAAATNNGYALQYASPKLLGNRDVVLPAVANNDALPKYLARAHAILESELTAAGLQARRAAAQPSLRSFLRAPAALGGAGGQ